MGIILKIRYNIIVITGCKKTKILKRVGGEGEEEEGDL
jgi:hypothetical protein